MKDLKEFEYYLWLKEENGVKHYWIKLKATGESCEVTHDVMKCLRLEEKRVRREMEAEAGRNLSYDMKPVEHEDSLWLVDESSFEEDILIEMMTEGFQRLLTPTQFDVYRAVMMGGQGIREYARINGRDPKSVHETVEAIRKKYKKYFS